MKKLFVFFAFFGLVAFAQQPTCQLNSMPGFLSAQAVSVMNVTQRPPQAGMTSGFQGLAPNLGLTEGLGMNPAISPGEILSITGIRLTGEVATEVSFNGGSPVPVMYAGPRRDKNMTNVYSTELLVMVPYSAKTGNGTISLQVVQRNHNGQCTGNTLTLPAVAVTPGLLAVQDAYGSPLNTVRAGNAVVAFATGLGPVEDEAVMAGTVPTGPASVTAEKTWFNVLLMAKNSPAYYSPAISYVGVTPGYSGLYQINFHIPEIVRAGKYTAVISSAWGTIGSFPIEVQ